MIKLLFILICFLPKPAFADINIFVGLSNIYTNINDNQYKFKNEYEQIGNGINSSVGISYNNNNIFSSISTNRLLNRSNNREVINSRGSRFDLKSKVETDSLSIGYLVSRFNPSLFVARVDAKKDLYYKGNHVGKTNDVTISYGFSGGYFITKDINAGIILVAPNETLNMEFGGGVFINYYL